MLICTQSFLAIHKKNILKRLIYHFLYLHYQSVKRKAPESEFQFAPLRRLSPRDLSVRSMSLKVSFFAPCGVSLLLPRSFSTPPSSRSTSVQFDFDASIQPFLPCSTSVQFDFDFDFAPEIASAIAIRF
ncbi:hypothetical protein LXL04_008770 [Taraxacum kok-saghyz]